MTLPFPPICARCQVPMKQGIGINPTTPDWQLRSMRGPEVAINHETLTLDPVWKCPKCGHSRDIT